jgi:1-acyl-sn-glycerol-3-phosphate acyltransferase
VRSSELNAWWEAVSAVAMLLFRLVFRVRIEGVEHVPAVGPAILAFNHVSVLDGPVVAIVVARRCRRESRSLVAAEVFDGRITGRILRSFDQIPIRRGAGDADALAEAIRTVRQGAIASIAPEGRVAEDPTAGLQRVRRGVARLAFPTEAPVIPVGIWGTQVRWPKAGLRLGKPWRPRAAVVLGQPLRPEGDPKRVEDIDRFTDRVREAIELQVRRARAIAEV